MGQGDYPSPNIALILPNSNSSHRSLPVQKSSSLSVLLPLSSLRTIHSSLPNLNIISSGSVLPTCNTSMTTTNARIGQFALLYDLLKPLLLTPGGGRPSRWRRSTTWRSPSSPKIHQKYNYMWNNSYRTPTECWQKTSDLAEDLRLPKRQETPHVPG